MHHGLVDRVGGFVGENARRQAAHQLRHLLGGRKRMGKEMCGTEAERKREKKKKREN